MEIMNSLQYPIACQNMHPFLLEVNPGPDFKIAGSKLSPLISDMLDGAWDIVAASRQASGVPGPQRTEEAPDAFGLSPATPLELSASPAVAAMHGWKRVLNDTWKSGSGMQVI